MIRKLIVSMMVSAAISIVTGLIRKPEPRTCWMAMPIEAALRLGGEERP